VLIYIQGYNAAITYTPHSDAYEVSFFRASSPAPVTSVSSASATPAGPHGIIAPLLSDRLNQLASRAIAWQRSTSAREFIQVCL
jgi:hypothetical protein